MGTAVSSIFKYRPEWQSGFKLGISFFPRDPDDRSYWGMLYPVFPEYGGLGLKSRTGDGNGKKTGLIIPYWIANCFTDDLEQVKEQKTPVLGIVSFMAGSGFSLRQDGSMTADSDVIRS